ncbi:hypothetical protein GCM10022393_43410 [Aquimarina addita]|uniref:NTF2 fold immunity protein domain-containing protein n=1 Tax=Aquimarina addita TaxID=870485 RepID=A0ABP6UZN5_9FLAO
MDLTKKARTYQFENREFTTQEIDLIAGQSGLVGISFKNCQISDSDIEKISTLKKLVNVTLENTEITDLSLKYLSKAPNLQYLFITKAMINGEGLSYFKDHKKLNTLWLVDTNLDDEGIQFLKDFKKLGIVRIDKTNVTLSGLMSIASNKKLQIVPNDKITKEHIKLFESEQQKLNKKKLEYNQVDIVECKLILNSFFTEMTNWEKYAEKIDDFTDELTNKCLAVFKTYCIDKERKGFRPMWSSYSSGPNYTYSNQKITDFEQPTKNKVLLYTKDEYLNSQYRFIILKKDNEWKIDECYYLDSGWKKNGL